MPKYIDIVKLTHEYYKNPSYHQLCKVLNEAPIEKVISVEWIEKYLTSFREIYEKIDDEWKTACRAGWVIYVIENMLKEWEKENENIRG